MSSIETILSARTRAIYNVGSAAHGLPGPRRFTPLAVPLSRIRLAVWSL